MKQKAIKKRLPFKKKQDTKLLQYGLGAGALLGGGYLLFTYLQNRAASNRRLELPPLKDDDSGASLPPIVLQNKAALPLVKGARGALVAMLQEALLAIGGSAAAIIKQTSLRSGKPDGVFGNGTAKALLAAGMPVVVTQSVFSRLLSMTRNTGVVNGGSNQGIALGIISAANTRNLFAVLSGLQKIKNTRQYVAVSNFFKGIRIRGTRVSSLVNALLSVAFVSNEPAKGKIRSELRRIGLLQNSAGVWSVPSLSGFDNPTAFNQYIADNQIYKIAITDRATLLKTAAGEFIQPPLNANTLVGYLRSQSKGITQIISPSGQRVYAPSDSIVLI